MGIEVDAKRGVSQHYGVRETTSKYGGEYGTKNSVKTVEWEFTYDDLPDAATNGLGYSIPANARIVSAKFIVDAAWTSTSGTTDLTVGLQQANGTEIDNDGLLTAVNLADGSIEDAADVGSVIDGSGALVGASIGANAGELTVAGTVDDLTAGAARVIVEYTKA
jgi:hypothetical protein